MPRWPAEAELTGREEVTLGGLLDDLRLIAFAIAIVLFGFLLWQALEKGGDLAKVGQAATESTAQRDPIPPPPPTQLPSSKTIQMTEAPAPASTEEGGAVYRWVDENGTISFSDKPMVAKAERIAVPSIEANTYQQTTEPVRPSRATRGATPVNQLRTELKETQSAAKIKSTRAKQVAKGTFVTSEGHRITAFASHFGEQLSFEGRVSRGERCQSLRLTGHIKDNDGRAVRLRAMAEKVGGTSRIFESRPMRVSPLKNGWELFRIDAVCVVR